jgi:predicted ester cyclase
VEHAFATDDMAAAYVRYAGTHSGDTEDQLGVPATGQTVEWVVMVHLRFECGKIAEIWSVGDELGKLQRMGVITADELLSVEPVATPAP